MFIRLFYLLILLKVILSDDNVYLKKEDIAKLPLTTLKNMLKLKGLVCKKCIEKDDFVNEVYKSQSLPVVDPPITDIPSNTNKQKDPKKQKDMDDLFNTLKSNGLGNSKIFTADDLKDLTPEQMNAKFANNDNKSSKKDKKKKKKEKSNTSSNTKENKKSTKKDKKKEMKTARIVTDDETIEL